MAAIASAQRKPLVHNWARRLQRFAVPQAERCEICGATIPAEHAHLVDIVGRRLLCACRVCAATASGRDGPFRLPPQHARALPGFRMSDAEWDSLQIPIDMAFILHSSPEARPVALYPGPAGATESVLGLEGWEQLVATNPVLATMQPDVEALLINRTHAEREYYLLPIDRCYALVGTIRRQWRGRSGGREVWEAIGAFFDRVRYDAQEAAR
jgi:Family of unknown function (DUF5947)